MPYNFKIDYLTTSRRNVVRGLGYPMASSNEGGYFAQSVDKELLINNLLQGIKTQKGERVMYPDFGTTIKYRLFDPITEETLSEIKQEIDDLIRLYYPRIEIRSLRLGSLGLGNDVSVTDGNTISIQLDVKFKDTIFEEETINIIIE